MAKAQGKTIAKSTKDVMLDTSCEHPALTPTMRRLAGELWALVQAKAVAKGFPITKAELRADTDVEGITWVSVAAWCDAPSDRAFAFHHGLDPEYTQWIEQLDDEHRELKNHPMLDLYWIPAARINGGV